MIFALDVGNTNITIGLFEGAKLTHNWRLRTVRDQTSDEWGILLRNLFDIEKLRLADVDGIIISSVVPPVDSSLAAMSRHYFHREPQFVTSSTNTGLKILYDNPREVGADRIVNSVAAFHRYGGPCVVVDLGTAITFDAITANAEYLGGVICPGIGMSVQGLFTRTARLPLVDFREPDSLIGSNTVGSMQSGLYYGVIGMIDGILERMLRQLGPGTQTVATGGQAELIIAGSKHLTQANPDLTLEGLQLIWQQTQS